MIFFRNALSLNMLDQLHAALSPDTPDLHVIIITHTGPVFSAGHDLKELVLLPVCLSLVLSPFLTGRMFVRQNILRTL